MEPGAGPGDVNLGDLLSEEGSGAGDRDRDFLGELDGRGCAGGEGTGTCKRVTGLAFAAS